MTTTASDALLALLGYPEHLVGRPRNGVLLTMMRAALDWSQPTVATACGVSLFSIHRWETGKTTPSTMGMVVLAFLFACPELALPGRWHGPGAQLQTEADVRRALALDAALVERSMTLIAEGRGLTGPALLHWGIEHQAGIPHVGLTPPPVPST